MARILISILLILSTIVSYGQVVTGIIIDKESKEPVVGAEVSLLGTNNIVITNRTGTFKFFDLKKADHILKVKADGYSYFDKPFKIGIDPVLNKMLEDVDLGEIEVESSTDELIQDEEIDQGLAVLNFDDLDDSNDDSEVSSLLGASRDPFNSVAAYNFRSVSYQLRGYNRDQTIVHLNGLKFNDIEDGGVYWGTWGGLNDVFRARDDEQGLFTTEFSFGGLSGDSDIDLRASAQWKQLRMTYNRTNISYANRAMLTYSTGMLKSGWAFSFSGSKRWGERGYIEGTNYDAYSYFGAIEKKINDKHSLNLNVFASAYRRGRSSAGFKEIYELLDNNYYNPNWGYQAGKIRNSREYRAHQPIFMLRHDFKVSRKTKIITSAVFQTGYNASTGLNWFLAADPRPDYYRKLPGFQETPEAQQLVSNYFQSNPDALQLQWDKMININKTRGSLGIDIGGTGLELPEGNFSAYTMESTHFDQTKLALQSHINTELSQRSNLAGGFQLTYDQNHNYRVLDDLLGGDYSVDLNRFAIRDFPGDLDPIQNDLNNPNRILKEGDKTGHDYIIHNQKAEAWATVDYSLAKFDFFVGGQVDFTRFWREGLVRNGLFPESSFGEGEKSDFLNGGVKAGVTYKVNGRNYFYANGVLMNISPYSRYTFLSARTRDQKVSNLESQKVNGGELGYIVRFPNLKGRATLFYTTITNQTINRSFFNDDLQSFVNYVTNGLDTKHMGYEIGIDYSLTSSLQLKAGISNGRYTITSRPTVTITRDNDAALLVKDRTIYVENYNVPNMPRLASSAGITYRNPNYWFVSLSANYITGRYTDINPERRTANAVDGVSKEEEPELWGSIIDQEELSTAFTMDLFGKKSVKINDYFLEVLLSVNNILDNQGIEKRAYEQSRFDYQNKDVNRFPTRYSYNFGRTFSVSLTFRH